MNPSRRSSPLYLLLLSLCFGGCGGFKGVVTPTLSSISPSSVTAGSPAFKLTANGTNYTAGSLILWNGIALPTTVVSNTQLTTSISAALIALAGTASIRVIKPDTTTSSAMQLEITGSGSQSFSLSSISPATVTAGSSSFPLIAAGTGFVTGSVITLNGTGVATTFDSPTQLRPRPRRYSYRSALRVSTTGQLRFYSSQTAQAL